ncbi:MAG: hypothetical protein IBJ16_11825 [Chitinophagaceae bacterium]|nr:hypothetical protein [Chitinophagaceae bacterium]
MKPVIISLFILLTGCKSTKGDFVISDVSKDTVVLIKTNSNDNTTVILSITGQVDDTCIVGHWIKIPGGNIDTTVQHDFYNKDYLLKYESYKASNGSIKINYHIP